MCTENLDFNIGKVCFVAYTEYEGGILNFEVTEQLENVLLTSALPSAAFLIVLFGVLISYTAVKLCCCKRQNPYVPVNAEAR